ncbi:MAG: DUF1573 domain-containing protein [Bacteroidaceae bacterium]|nr:DUF1573 domain-containing protein [Bacteroidaceae bacterium]
MKRSSILLYLFFVAVTSVFAQPRISSNTKTFDFGQVQWKQPVTASYVITNTGNKPLVMTNVTTSCACSVADWTKSPIAPGKTGDIRVVFDAKALGHFNKSVGIYSNAKNSLVYLNFIGEVCTKITDFSKANPFVIDKIFMSTNRLDFPDVHLGDKVKYVFTVVNNSDYPYEPQLMQLPPYITMVKEPNTLMVGKRGTVTLTLDSKKLRNYGLEEANVYLSRFPGDKVCESNKIPVSVIVLPKAKEMNTAHPPVIGFSEKKIDVSSDLVQKKKIKKSIYVLNSGKSPLKIKRLQIFNPAISVDLKKTTIYPGQATKMNIEVKQMTKDNNVGELKILIITNDPAHAKVEIQINR